MMVNNKEDRDAALIHTRETRLPRVYVAMLGSRLNYAVPRLLYQDGMLGKFYTDTYIGNKPVLGKLLRAIPSRIRARKINQLLGRGTPEEEARVMRVPDICQHGTKTIQD